MDVGGLLDYVSVYNYMCRKHTKLEGREDSHEGGGGGWKFLPPPRPYVGKNPVPDQ